MPSHSKRPFVGSPAPLRLGVSRRKAHPEERRMRTHRLGGIEVREARDVERAVDPLVEGGKLDFPASLSFAGEGANRALYVPIFAYLNATQGMPAHPALLRVRLSP